MPTSIGLLHPGEMGATVGQVLVRRGHEVLWVSAGRSDATRQRAAAAGLSEVMSLGALSRRAAVVLAICPPVVAVDLADSVARTGFGGLYLDANAISPASAARVEATMASTAATVVDGGVVGPPPRAAGTTRLYLSGSAALSVAELFAETELEPVVVPGGVGAASAVKTCYASWTKTTAALVLAIRAVARAHGVEDALRAEWARSQPQLETASEQAATQSAPKAWRWVAEMEEHAATFEAAGLPGGFDAAAAVVFDRLKDLRLREHATLDDVLAAVARSTL